MARQRKAARADRRHWPCPRCRRSSAMAWQGSAPVAFCPRDRLLFGACGKMVIQRIQIPRHGAYILIGPTESSVMLPAAHLFFKTGPVGSEPFGTPVHMGGMAGDAMC